MWLQLLLLKELSWASLFVVYLHSSIRWTTCRHAFDQTRINFGTWINYYTLCRYDWCVKSEWQATLYLFQLTVACYGSRKYLRSILVLMLRWFSNSQLLTHSLTHFLSYLLYVLDVGAFVCLYCRKAPHLHGGPWYRCHCSASESDVQGHQRYSRDRQLYLNRRCNLSSSSR